MPVWTPPRTWVAGEIPTADTFNAHIRDNLLTLKTPTRAETRINFGSNYTTTSLSWVEIDPVVLSQTIVTNGGQLLVVVRPGLSISASPGFVYLDIAIDGTRIGNTTFGMAQASLADNGVAVNGGIYWSPVLAAGTHTIRPQWKVSTGTGSLSYIDWWTVEVS
jgi:hypothetical protein